jgi:transposase
MSISLDKLSDDPDTLKQIIVDLHEERDSLLEQLRIAIKREFGRSSEAAPGQHELFNEAEQEDKGSDDEVETPTVNDPSLATTPTARKTPGRKPLPKHLPRVEVIYDLDEQSAQCAEDGTALKVIGEEVTEQLDIIPAQIRVIRKVRKTYACPQCESVIRAPKPGELLPKSRASADLLVQIAMYKYQDALPLYRQQKMFERLGVTLDRSTMANWMVAVGQKLAPLVEQMRVDALAVNVLHADETTIQVLKEAGRRPDQKSYMWVQSTGTGPPIVIYHYAPSRAQSVVEHLFSGYQGTLVTDGYAAYRSLTTATHAGCWAHARRKFNDALKLLKGSRTGKAQVGFNYIQRLFVLEKQWLANSAEERHQLRQLHSQPIIDDLGHWLEKSLPTVAPKSQLGRAMKYLQGQWEKLTVFLTDGDIPIHNNQAENKIRPFVIGRKNWMFSDSVNGAESSAAIYSLIETAKANDMAPDIYLSWLFRQLPDADLSSTESVRSLLPYGADLDVIAAGLSNADGKH